MIPILERLLYRKVTVTTTRVVVLVPTRELGVQVHAVAEKLAQFVEVEFALAIGETFMLRLFFFFYCDIVLTFLSLVVGLFSLGGLSLKMQAAELKKRPDVVIATPGRLIDHARNTPGFTLDSVEILVMDEADRMLEDGFEEELKEILKMCPKGRQTMLFSATMTDDVSTEIFFFFFGGSF
jgi:ATP-dependent RNA helicase DDX27